MQRKGIRNDDEYQARSAIPLPPTTQADHKWLWGSSSTLAGDQASVYSGGSQPAEGVNPRRYRRDGRKRH